MTTVQFVNSIASSPTVRLDLNTGEWGLIYEGTEIGMPRLERAVADTLLADGALYPASAYGNRTLTLRLKLVCTSVDEVANELQKLARELDRANNILKWQPPSATNPVFFRTFRSDIVATEEIPGNNLAKIVTAEVVAEPFALGLKETVTPITVSNNPAAANGNFFDVSSVKGDVETPLILKVPTTNRGDQSVFAVRRRGTPSSAPGFLQAESMTLGTDTTTPANESTMSGAGNNYARCSFATNADWAVRISAGSPWPASASVDNRGTYRVFLRCRKTTGGDTAQVRLTYGATNTSVTNSAVTLPASSSAITMLDLGLLSIPLGTDPVHDGYTNSEIAARGLYVAVEARRTSGATSVDFDYLAFIPADDRLAFVDWTANAGAADRLILDGAHEVTYGIVNATGDLVSMTPGSVVGGFPMLTPNQTNRVYHLNEVAPGTAEPTFPTTWSFEPFYFPRYIYVRPAST